MLPDFQQFVTSVFEGKRDSKVAIYEDFSPAGASAALRFGLMCLLDDLYGGEDSGLNGYLNAILSTLLDVSSTSLGVGSGRGREALDLMDSCSFCLAGVLRSSAFARHSTANNGNVNHMFLSNLSIAAASSKSRRLLAESCGYLYEDMEFWKDHIDRAMGLTWSKTKQYEVAGQFPMQSWSGVRFFYFPHSPSPRPVCSLLGTLLGLGVPSMSFSIPF